MHQKTIDYGALQGTIWGFSLYVLTLLEVSDNKSEHFQEYLWCTLIIQTSTLVFQGEIPSIIWPTTKYAAQFGLVNNYPSDKESLSLIPLFTHPLQQIKPWKEINNESAEENPNYGSRKDEVDLQIKTIRPHPDNESSKIGFTCAVEELDEKR